MIIETINENNETILTNEENGISYRIGQRGRRPDWVIVHLASKHTDVNVGCLDNEEKKEVYIESEMKDNEDVVSNIPNTSGELVDSITKSIQEISATVQLVDNTIQPIQEITKKKDNKMTIITKTETYKNFIDTLDTTHYIHEGQVKEVADLKDIMVRLSLTATQCGIQPMIFNADFNSVQKASDGSLVMSAECVNRNAFDKNDLQDHFSTKGIMEQCSFLRGGIKTDANKKENNCCFTKAINTRAIAVQYKEHDNDRLGFKADDDGENYLCEETLYTDAVFVVDVNFSVNHFMRNIFGMDFAQKNALKVIEATEDEVKEMLDYCVPTKDGVLNLDAIIDLIIKKFSNLKYFSHRGVCAEFKVEKIKETIDIL